MFGDSSYFWLHIVANMIPLICLGPALEEMLGHVRYLGALSWRRDRFGAGLAALQSRTWTRPIIGASGAVFAIIAGIGVAAPRARG